MSRFTKGKPKTGGRRRGTSNRGTERARRLISEGDDKEIVDAIVRDAKNNDVEARRLYLRHLRPPPPRETFVGPIDYTKPKTVEEARAALLELGVRLAKHEISVELHDSLIAGIKAYLADRTVEQEERLMRIEDTLRRRGSA